MNGHDYDVATYYAALFAARTDAYAGWLGSSWVCRREPLTAEVIANGFNGGSPVSGYTITPAGTTHVAAIDFDTENGLTMARSLRAAMAHKGIHGYVEVSRRGAHVWVLLDAPLAAKTVRRAMRAFLRDAGIPESPKVELRPSHDEISPDGFGSPLRLPTMPHPKTGQRYPLLDWDDSPLPAQLDRMLLALDDSPSITMIEMAQTIRPSIKDAKSGDRKPYHGPTVEGSASDILRTLWGAVDARPNHSIRCPAHDDKVASLNILPDDQRAMCMAGGCILNNSDRGRGTYELTTMAPRAK